jgi:photosystem II stability/assembly factor-like uncharacterized protein
MKLKPLVSAVVALALALPALSSMAAETPRELLGDPAPDASAERTVSITPETKYVNVQGGQIVKFDVGGKTFTWDFDTAETVMSFDLNRVAPDGLLDHAITAYVSPNPLYIQGR